MDKTLELIDRFFQIMLSNDSKNNERLNSEWTYLLNLLKSTPVAYDRIDAYLNILQNSDSRKRKGKSSQTEHPLAKSMLNSV